MKDQQQRIETILQVLLEYTLRDFSKEIPITENRDEIDAVAIGINTLGQELEYSLKELQEKARILEIRNKELEQFVYITSHDLREPLLTISSLSGMLKQEYGEQFDQTASLYIGYLQDAAGRLNSLITGLMEYLRVGQENSVPEIVNLNGILTGVLEDMHSDIEISNARVSASPLPEIKARSEEIRKLFSHLISNSLKFRSRSATPEIMVKVRDNNDQWLFSVTDNGIGIEPHHQHKIFQMFQRLYPRDSYSGLGMGLTYCRKVVEQYNGRIWLESQPDEGSTFYFTFPKAEHEETR